MTDIKIRENRRSAHIMTKYEVSRVLGLRVSQLANGASSNIDVPENYIDPAVHSGDMQLLKIAIYELLHKQNPFIIRRVVNGEAEYFKTAELDISSDIFDII